MIQKNGLLEYAEYECQTLRNMIKKKLNLMSYNLYYVKYTQK